MIDSTGHSRATDSLGELVIRIERRLMAPCCYTQTINLHMSEIAQRMRQEVERMVNQGRTEIEIISHYKGLYGEQILAVPDGSLGEVAFGTPITIASLATSSLVLFLHRLHRRKIAVANVSSHSPVSTSKAVQNTSPLEDKQELLKRIRGDTCW